MKTLTVDVKDYQYPVYVGTGIGHRSDLLHRHIRGQQVMVITDQIIDKQYPRFFKDVLADYEADFLVLQPGEEQKRLKTVSGIFDVLMQKKYHRDATLVAFGGGVIGDMVGFSAACYQRGIPFIQMPTTLLAQVDSSVGGKTGVNHPQGKNMIGAFYQPECVIADTFWLDTLPTRELLAGLAEVIKYGLIGDYEFFEWIETHVEDILAKDSETMRHVIYVSCENKADIVNQDEKEKGIRATLNFGHTFGHALETITEYKHYLHGEAVAIGMVMATKLSQILGFLDEETVERVRQLFVQLDMPLDLPKQFSFDAFVEAMKVDKKVQDGRIRFIVLSELGAAAIVDDVTEEEIKECVAYIREECTVN